jgi:hypothetical protein
MSQPTSDNSPSDRQTAEEMAAIPYEPLLPAEIWLVSGSLFLGLLLLGLLLWLSATYYPMVGP